jgi:hypothetical protein
LVRCTQDETQQIKDSARNDYIQDSQTFTAGFTQ